MRYQTACHRAFELAKKPGVFIAMIRRNYPCVKRLCNQKKKFLVISILQATLVLHAV
jgi:hypothetical protein